MPSILTVCRANVCRSPLAAHLLAGGLAANSGLADLTVTSAGLAPAVGTSACRLASAGIPSLAAHEAAVLSADAVRAATLVLTMERSQRGKVAALVPGAQLKVFTLSEAADLAGEAVHRGVTGLGADEIVAQLHALRGQVTVLPPRRRGVAGDDIADGHGAGVLAHRRAVRAVRSESTRLVSALEALVG